MNGRGREKREREETEGERRARDERGKRKKALIAPKEASLSSLFRLTYWPGR